MVVQGHVRLAAAQAVVPEKVKRTGVRGHGGGDSLPTAGGRELLASPQEEGHVALLALPALHGAVQGGAGVSEGEVVELAVRARAAALIRLKTTRDGRSNRSASGTFRKKPQNLQQMSELAAGIRFRATDSPGPWT